MLVMGRPPEEDKPAGLGRADFEALATEEYRSAHPGTLPSDCPVCFTGFADGDMVTVLPCAHGFCGKCTRRWMANHTTCPLCRLDCRHAADGGLVGRGRLELPPASEGGRRTPQAPLAPVSARAPPPLPGSSSPIRSATPPQQPPVRPARTPRPRLRRLVPTGPFLEPCLDDAYVPEPPPPRPVTVQAEASAPGALLGHPRRQQPRRANAAGATRSPRSLSRPRRAHAPSETDSARGAAERSARLLHQTRSPRAAEAARTRAAAGGSGSTIYSVRLRVRGATRAASRAGATSSGRAAGGAGGSAAVPVTLPSVSGVVRL